MKLAVTIGLDFLVAFSESMLDWEPVLDCSFSIVRGFSSTTIVEFRSELTSSNEALSTMIFGSFFGSGTGESSSVLD